MKTFDEIYEEICEEFIRQEKMNKDNRANEPISTKNSFSKIWQSIKSTYKKIRGNKFLSVMFNIILFLHIIVIILTEIPVIITFIALDVCVWLLILWGKQREKKRTKYKEIVINKLIKNYSNKFCYYPKGKISLQEYEESTFGKYFSHSEDLIEGVILDNCKIKMSDVVYSTDGNSIPAFEGIFAKITLTKNSNTLFRMERHAYRLFNKEKKIKLNINSPEFEKIYDIFTNDKISTSKILTPDLIQILMNFIHEHNIFSEIALSNNNLYLKIFINSSVTDIFEPKGDLLNKAHIEETYNMINLVFEFIETLTKNILEKCEN